MAQVSRTVTIPRTPPVVWRRFASQEALRGWLSPTLEIDLAEGGAYRMLGADGDTWISGVVLELVAEERLVLSWLEENAGWQHPGRLVIALRPAGEQTEVTLIHDGFAGIGSPRWRDIRDAYARGFERHHVLEDLSRAVLTSD